MGTLGASIGLIASIVVWVLYGYGLWMIATWAITGVFALVLGVILILFFLIVGIPALLLVTFIFVALGLGK